MHRAPAGAKFGLREKQKYSPHPGGICISLLLEGSALLRSSRGHEGKPQRGGAGTATCGTPAPGLGGPWLHCGTRGGTCGAAPPHCATSSGGAAWLGRGPAQHWAGVGADPGWSWVPRSRVAMLDPPPPAPEPPQHRSPLMPALALAPALGLARPRAGRSGRPMVWGTPRVPPPTSRCPMRHAGQGKPSHGQ